jgi:hypothetical protein
MNRRAFFRVLLAIPLVILGMRTPMARTRMREGWMLRADDV